MEKMDLIRYQKGTIAIKRYNMPFSEDRIRIMQVRQIVSREVGLFRGKWVVSREVGLSRGRWDCLEGGGIVLREVEVHN